MEVKSLCRSVEGVSGDMDEDVSVRSPRDVSKVCVARKLPSEKAVMIDGCYMRLNAYRVKVVTENSQRADMFPTT